MTEPAGWLTFRELDARCGAPKGTSFRAFKDVEPTLAEGRDFRVLRAATDAGPIVRLREAGRIYPLSRNVVMLSPPLAERLEQALRR